MIEYVWHMIDNYTWILGDNTRCVQNSTNNANINIQYDSIIKLHVWLMFAL